MRFLAQTGLVVRERRPTGRGDLFRIVDGDLWGTIMRARHPILDRYVASLDEAVALLDAGSQAARAWRRRVTTPSSSARRWTTSPSAGRPSGPVGSCSTLTTASERPRAFTCYGVLTGSLQGWRNRPVMGWTGLVDPVREEPDAPEADEPRGCRRGAGSPDGRHGLQCDDDAAVIPGHPHGSSRVLDHARSRELPHATARRRSRRRLPVEGRLRRAGGVPGGDQGRLLLPRSVVPHLPGNQKAIGRDGIPAGLTLVKVDFDTENDLRKKYRGHHAAHLRAGRPVGCRLAKWTGSIAGAEILAKTV